MKSAAKPFYFSAYPLKAIKDANSVDKQPESPYLKAILSGIAKTSSRVRVFPMSNPYHQKFTQVTPVESKLPNDIELTEKEWFNNYE